jgi:mono/diheme cytochrome c family protein
MPLTLALVAAPGCTDTIDLDPVDDTPVRQATVRPPAISGGTLAIDASGTVAVAADPDRDQLYIVDLTIDQLRHRVALEPGDEPGRVAFGSADLAHVVLRGSGQIATIDLVSGSVVGRRSVCNDPRGLAFDDASATLHVGCADGTLAHLGEAMDGEVVTEMVAPDLRDVVLVDGQVHVSRFRAAEIVAPDGGTLGPDPQRGFSPVTGQETEFESHVAWKTWTDPDPGGEDRILMLHQIEDTDPVRIEPDAPEDDGGDFGGGGLPYGGGGGGFGCDPGIASAAITVIDHGQATTVPLPGVGLAVDAAVSPDRERVAVAVPGANDGHATVLVAAVFEGCPVVPVDRGEGQVTAVGWTADDRLVMFSREPAQLVIRDGSNLGAQDEIIALSDESRFDTGHEIFHRATESNLTCATCHPEAGDDGHVWAFVGLGKRRTQPLDVGLRDTAPFHWDGEMSDLDMIMDEVLSHRMGGMRQSPQRRESFASWIFDRERPPARADAQPDLVAQGQARFTDLGCATCHAGSRLMSNETVELGGKMLQVPSLRRIALRPPYMHDGRSLTLEAAVADMIVATHPSQNVDDADVDSIAAFLRTQ